MFIYIAMKFHVSEMSEHEFDSSRDRDVQLFVLLFTIYKSVKVASGKRLKT